MNKPRTLEQVCETTEGFAMELQGNVYCSIGMSRYVKCPYHAKDKDHNGLRPCTNPKYMSLALDYNNYKVEQ